MADDFADLREAMRPAPSCGLSMVPIKDIVCQDQFKKFKALERDWEEFCHDVLRQAPEPDDEPFSTPLSIKTIYVFLRFLVRRGKGADGCISTATVTRKWQELQRLTLLRCNHTYMKSEKKYVRNFIQKLPDMEGASTSGRAKPLASVELAKHLLHFLWVCDEYIFKHPRITLQLSFAILVMMYQGLRPGEFNECSSQRGLNEGFTYQDFALQAQPGSHGEKRRWVLQITVRLRKNHRGNQRDNVTHILTDEPGNPHLCPVTHFCALAFADGAFQNLRSPEDLNRVKTGATVRIKDSVKHTSVLRRLDQAGHVSPTLVFGADSLNFYLNGLGERAGYRDNLTAYAFRHGHGNKLDQMLSSVQRRQRMGHKSDDTFQYYISRISGVDTQSIMPGREPRQELMDHVRSMANHHDPVAPALLALD